MHRLRLAAAAAAAALAATALAHGDHASQAPLVAADADWMTRHMAEEHHMNAWDAASFFALHDYNGDGLWHVDEMQRTYGLMDESNSGLAQSKRDDVARQLLALLDADADGAVTRAEWDAFIHAGKTLPDLGTGPGHHNDAEYEYEIHHWDKYHDENTKLEDLTHPEDIEHFKKHDDMEDEAERIERLNKMAIVEANIPSKFRR